MRMYQRPCPRLSGDDGAQVTVRNGEEARGPGDQGQQGIRYGGRIVCELCDDDRVTIVEPRDCDGGLACPHGDECGVDLAALSSERGDRLLSATQLVSEADKMAGDCHTNALAATTWGARWHWWTSKRAALALAWHLSFIDGPAREQSTYTSLDLETPWGVTLEECWQRWLRETRGETVPL